MEKPPVAPVAVRRIRTGGRWTRPWIVSGAAVVAVAILLAGCSSGSDGSSAGSPLHRAGSFVIPFDGANGSSADQAPTCVGPNPSVSGPYGQEWCFGATFAGGGHGNGIVYRVKPDGSQFSVLWNFDVLTGLLPSIGVAVAPDRSSLYGATTQGGSTGSGMIWAFDTATSTVTNLHSFSGGDGTTPQSAPILVNGTLYGLTGQSGANGVGSIYSQSTTGGGFAVLHQFAGGRNDLANPYGALTFDPADGLLYGMAFGGGANGMGGIFSIRPDGTGYSLRASLSSATGGMPQMEALVLAPDHTFLGVGWAGGNGAGVNGAPGDGTIFRFDPSTGTVTKIFEFTAQTGTQPYESLGMSPDGKWLYATCWHGGANQLGTVLAVRSDGSESRVLVNLDMTTTGGFPFANAAVSFDGSRLVTATAAGAANNLGALLSIPLPADLR